MSRVIITGGGTAGHTNPGIAIGQALVELGLAPADIHFVGGERGNEGTLVPAAGFSIDLLPGRGIQRSLRPRGIVDNVGAVRGLLMASVRALRLVRRHRPAVVVCLGGYAAFPTSAAAVLARVPIVVSEQNARASAVNRLAGRFAAVCALPYPDTDLPNGVVTGNPIRAEVLTALAGADRSRSRKALGLPDDRTVLAIWSGSLGARSVNEVAADLARRWRDRSDVAIHHVVGRRDWDDYAALGAELAAAPLHYQSVAYEDRMPEVLTAADVAITRAGASTTAELAAAGLPALLVPLPAAPRDHQRANARELVEARGGWSCSDRELSVEVVEQLFGPMIDDPSRIGVMAEAARSVGRPDAARAVAQLVLDTERRSSLPGQPGSVPLGPSGDTRRRDRPSQPGSPS